MDMRRSWERSAGGPYAVAAAGLAKSQPVTGAFEWKVEASLHLDRLLVLSRFMSKSDDLRVSHVLGFRVLECRIGLEQILEFPGMTEVGEQEPSLGVLEMSDPHFFSHFWAGSAYLLVIAAPDDVVELPLVGSSQQGLEGLVLGDSGHANDAGDTVVDLVPQSRLDQLRAEGLLDGDDVVFVDTNTIRVGSVITIAVLIIAELDDDFLVVHFPGAIDGTTVNQAENIGDGSSLGKVLEGDAPVRSHDFDGMLAGGEPLAEGEQELLRGANGRPDKLSMLLNRSEGSCIGVGTGRSIESSGVGWIFLSSTGRILT